MNRARWLKGVRRLGRAPKAVIQRWQRIRMKRKAASVARAYMRWRLPYRERKRRNALESAFETTRYYAIKNEGGRFRGMSTLFNIGLFLLIAERDIQAVKIDALTHPDEWTRKLHARVILLTIYEWNADKVAGRTLREDLETMQISQELRAEVFGALRALRGVQEKVNKNFTFLRNATIGHRDGNALLQYRAIRNLNVKEVWAIGEEFFIGVSKFIIALTKIMKASNTLTSYLNQWAKSDKAEAAKQPQGNS